MANGVLILTSMIDNFVYTSRFVTLGLDSPLKVAEHVISTSAPPTLPRLLPQLYPEPPSSRLSLILTKVLIRNIVSKMDSSFNFDYVFPIPIISGIFAPSKTSKLDAAHQC